MIRNRISSSWNSMSRGIAMWIDMAWYTLHRTKALECKFQEGKAFVYLIHGFIPSSVQFSSIVQSSLTLCDSMDCGTPGFPVHHQLLEFTQTHVHRVGDAIRPSHPLSSPSPPTFILSQHQGLFKWVSFSHEVAKVLEFQLQHQSFQWIFRTVFL